LGGIHTVSSQVTLVKTEAAGSSETVLIVTNFKYWVYIGLSFVKSLNTAAAKGSPGGCMRSMR